MRGERLPHGRARIEPRAVSRRAETSARAPARRPLQPFKKARGRGALGRGHRGEVRPTKELGRARRHPSGALDRGCHAVRHHADGKLDLTRLGLWPARAGDGHREASAAEERPEEIESQIKRGEVSLPGDERCAAGGAHVVRALEVDLRDRLEVHPRALRAHVDSSATKKPRKDQEVTRDTVADRRRHIVTGASSFALMQAKSCCVIFSAAPCMSRAPTCWIIPDTVTSLDHSIIVWVSSNSARSMLLTICTALGPLELEELHIHREGAPDRTDTCPHHDFEMVRVRDFKSLHIRGAGRDAGRIREEGPHPITRCGYVERAFKAHLALRYAPTRSVRIHSERVLPDTLGYRPCAMICR